MKKIFKYLLLSLGVFLFTLLIINVNKDYEPKDVVLDYKSINIKNNTNNLVFETILVKSLLEADLTDVNVNLDFINYKFIMKEDNLNIKGYVIKYNKGDEVYYNIYLDASVNNAYALEILSHEVIHILQYENGDLKDNEDGTIVYKNRTYNMNLNYFDRPWEVDAFNEGRKLKYRVKDEIFK